MTNKPKAIGTAAESAVVRYLQASGFPHAERRALRGELDAGDVTGCPGVCIEVKGGEAARSASDGDVTAWMKEVRAETLNADAQIGFLVMQRRAVGPKNAGRWWAVLTVDTIRILVSDPYYDATYYDQPVRMHLADAVHLLRAGGYGNPLEAS
jgi:hypothetical protein